VVVLRSRSRSSEKRKENDMTWHGMALHTRAWPWMAITALPSNERSPFAEVTGGEAMGKF